MRQVAADRMASVAFARAVEVCLSRLGIAGNYVESLIGSTVRGQLHLQVEIFGDVAELLTGERGECRHPFRRPAVVHSRTDELALVVVQDNGRPEEIGTACAPGIRPMTKPARGCEDFAALRGHPRIRHSAQT